MGPSAPSGEVELGPPSEVEAQEVTAGVVLLQATRSADTLRDANGAAHETEIRAVRMAVLLALGEPEWRILVKPWLDRLDAADARLLLALLGQQWRRGAFQGQADLLRRFQGAN